ncbi:hypothetical protein MAHJHV64_38010 [Mycobacterium avium subsp. hominissuis]|uniref:Uncharacterized protein n=1 Tax=Mycobacterium avium subsp. hominissuis TaxID=439334 RepID=A0AAI8SPJ5_MYCAV|nr:hypothetical protein JPH1_33880 [Mycobacterium avium subsp. hominissuis]
MDLLAQHVGHPSGPVGPRSPDRYWMRHDGHANAAQGRFPGRRPGSQPATDGIAPGGVRARPAKTAARRVIAPPAATGGVCDPDEQNCRPGHATVGMLNIPMTEDDRT